MNKVQTVLELPLESNDAGAKTVKEYLVKLLETVWVEEEGFSGKRPFGNSGWQYYLIEPVIKAGLAVTDSKAASLITEAIRSL